jgi:hypothetical protein
MMSASGPDLAHLMFLQAQRSAPILRLKFTESHSMQIQANQVKQEVGGAAPSRPCALTPLLVDIGRGHRLDGAGAFVSHLVQHSGVVECGFAHERTP